MKPNDYNTSNTNVATVIDENAGLQKFYAITQELSLNRKLKFTGKSDEIENIEWNFKYRGYPLTLQYSIYSGIILTPVSTKHVKVAYELADRLKVK